MIRAAAEINDTTTPSATAVRLRPTTRRRCRGSDPCDTIGVIRLVLSIKRAELFEGEIKAIIDFGK